MKRYALESLIKWKDSKNRKPLLIYGTRQVGKSWLMEEFGRNYFPDYIKINFEKNGRIKTLFEKTLNPKEILLGLEIEVRKKITKDTLIIFDEIQACKSAITALKYFYEDLPEYYVICAGSLLGVAIHEGFSFPVGKVDSMNLYPMNFFEFLDATGEQYLCDIIKNKQYDLVNSFKDKLINYVKIYFYVGGMPEVVKNYAEEKDFQMVRKIQKNILNNYKNDFSQHIPSNILDKTYKFWNSIPIQLSKESKKFVYKELENNARAKDYESVITWLKNSGLIYQIKRLSKPFIPTISYEEDNIFKIFLFDVGLLSASVDLDVHTLLENSSIFTEFRGAITEQFVLQELKTIEDININYWANKYGQAEIDFVVQIDSKVIPIEVKAGTNLKAKSLSTYNEKFKPEVCIRTSLAGYKKTDNLIDVPLYFIGMLKDIVFE